MKKVALIGLGNWGKILLNEFSKKAYVSNCITKGNLKNISWLRKNYPKIKYSKNYLEILNDKSIDIIVIATPISTHYQLILKALNSGKHVFVEKPLSNQYDQANYLKSIALKHNLCLFVGHTFIYHPVLNKIKTLIKTDPIIYFSMNWSKFGTFKENIFSFLKNCYCFFSTSLWEDPGFVLVEAGATNTIVISSDCSSGPKEILSNGKGGFLFQNNNLDSLKRAYEEFILLDEKSILLKKINVKKKSKNYTFFNHYKKINDYLSS